MLSISQNLWEFSNYLYRSPDVQDACLTLQDRFGADVNLLLFACWYGAGRGVMDTDLAAEAVRLSGQWSMHVVKPLRGARRWMKSPGILMDANLEQAHYSLRERIKAAELQAEHQQQLLLEALAAESVPDRLPEDAPLDKGTDNRDHIRSRYVMENLRRCFPAMARDAEPALQLLCQRSVAEFGGV